MASIFFKIWVYHDGLWVKIFLSGTECSTWWVLDRKMIPHYGWSIPLNWCKLEFGLEARWAMHNAFPSTAIYGVTTLLKEEKFLSLSFSSPFLLCLTHKSRDKSGREISQRRSSLISSALLTDKHHYGQNYLGNYPAQRRFISLCEGWERKLEDVWAVVTCRSAAYKESALLK